MLAATLLPIFWELLARAAQIRESLARSMSPGWARKSIGRIYQPMAASTCLLLELAERLDVTARMLVARSMSSAALVLVAWLALAESKAPAEFEEPVDPAKSTPPEDRVAPAARP
jgi:hypothetical protein